MHRRICLSPCRLALVAAFLVSPFGAAERTWKPFNPVLGETFEMDNVGNNVQFMAEQVRAWDQLIQHTPPALVQQASIMLGSGVP